MANLGRFEPIVVVIWGLIINLLIANGYLLPQQHDMWVNGGLELIGALGSVSLFSIWLHHSLTKTNQKQLNDSIQNMVTSINNSPNTSGGASIPMNNPANTVVHVNVP
jgi:hypothetical protein